MGPAGHVDAAGASGGELDSWANETAWLFAGLSSFSQVSMTIWQVCTTSSRRGDLPEFVPTMPARAARRLSLIHI